MDEMQRAFNVTTSALLETMRIADERDIKQNERLVSLDKRVEKMQQSMEAFENLLNDLKFQVIINNTRKCLNRLLFEYVISRPM